MQSKSEIMVLPEKWFANRALRKRINFVEVGGCDNSQISIVWL